MICEYEVRSIASPISSAIACSRWRTTETVIGSTSLQRAKRLLASPRINGVELGAAR